MRSFTCWGVSPTVTFCCARAMDGTPSKVAATTQRKRQRRPMVENGTIRMGDPPARIIQSDTINWPLLFLFSGGAGCFPEFPEPTIAAVQLPYGPTRKTTV